MRFPLGQVLCTPRIRDELGWIPMLEFIARHMEGDWGDVSIADHSANNIALETGERLLSAYDTVAGRVWVITEADRSATTVLFPDEY